MKSVWVFAFLSVSLLFFSGCGTVLTGAALLLFIGGDDDGGGTTPVSTADSTPPAPVTDLGAASGSSQGSVDLTWTAVGDDGNTGTAVSYLVKYSTTPITTLNFYSSTSYQQGWTPLPAGNTESHTLYGFTPGQTYYFAMLVYDEVPNTSDMSNVPSTTASTAPDTVAPSAITDLSIISGSTEGTLVLSWTAPGDDEGVGTVSAYIMKYSTSSIDAGNLDAAMTYVQSWTALGGGSSESRTLTGLTAGTLYYVAMKAQDEVPNVSQISNVPSASAGVDTVSPWSITDLVASEGTGANEIDLSWTSTGDDGNTGTASSYVVKYSTGPISESNFDAATTYAQSWVPQAPGNTENYTISLPVAGQLYYVAVKTLDEVPNVSGISNQASATAHALDIIAPAAVTDLGASSGTNPGEIDLTWTATGDDGTTGTASAYVVKYSTSLIDAGNFDPALTYTQSWAPQAAGNAENYTLTGLAGGQTYYIAIKVEDEEPNSSLISNVPSAIATQGPDTMAPGAIADLSASTGTSNGQIDVTFTATGDDGTTGTATSYVVKYALGPITTATFDSATTYTQGWTPAAAGNTEDFTLYGLTPGWTYNIAIKVVDEVPNTGAMSNVANATVSSAADTTAPAAISDLSASGSLARGSVDLSWTAVGDDANVGTATSYEIRYSTSAITSANWSSATQFPCHLTPKAGGQTENYTVSGLTSGTTYHFAIKVSDEVPNTGAVSNSPSTKPLIAFIWSHPTASMNTPTDIWGNSSTNIYGVSYTGTILHYSGSAWSVMSSGTTEHLSSIWGITGSDIFCVGWNGTVLHFDGNVWSSMSSGTSNSLYGVWGSSSNNVYAVGSSGTIIHYNGSTWSTMTSGTTQLLHDIHGISATDIWAGGNGATALHFNGTSWVNQNTGLSAVGRSVCCIATNDVWIAGSQSAWRWNGASWTLQNSFTTTAYGIWAISGSNVYVVGGSGMIRQWNGTSWLNHDWTTLNNMFSVWRTAANDVYASSIHGELLHYNGTSWSNQAGNLNTSTSSLIQGGFSISSNDAYVVGQETGGALCYHYDGNSWSRLNIGSTNSMYGVWASASNDVFTVGLNGDIWHYNGSSWSQQASGTTNLLQDVWGSSSTNLFAVGHSGTIIQGNGTSWSAMTSGTTDHLCGVWGLNSNYVIAVGSNGTILRYNGTSWSSMTSGTSTPLYNVWGSSMTDVYACGDSGLLLHYNGTSWSSITLGTTAHLRGVWGSSSADVYVVGFTGVGFHYDGTSWKRITKDTANHIWIVFGTSASDVFIAGANAGILHFP